jgi:hypothetical protein
LAQRGIAFVRRAHFAGCFCVVDRSSFDERVFSLSGAVSAHTSPLVDRSDEKLFYDPYFSMPYGYGTQLFMDLSGVGIPGGAVANADGDQGVVRADEERTRAGDGGKQKLKKLEVAVAWRACALESREWHSNNSRKDV